MKMELDDSTNAAPHQGVDKKPITQQDVVFQMSKGQLKGIIDKFEVIN